MRSLLILLLLSGCAFTHARGAEDAKTELVGLPKSEILSCMGAPLNSAVSGDLEVLSYDGSRSAVGIGTGRSGFLFGYSCRVSVVLVDGVVTRVNYSGRTGGLLTKGRACYPAVENCLGS